MNQKRVGEDGEDVQKDPPISEDSLGQETSNNYNNLSDNQEEIEENTYSKDSEDSKNMGYLPLDPPQVPHHTQVPQIEEPESEPKQGLDLEEMRKQIELAATEPTESVRYTCPICKGDQFKEDKEFHKKSCSGIKT